MTILKQIVASRLDSVSPGGRRGSAGSGHMANPASSPVIPLKVSISPDIYNPISPQLSLLKSPLFLSRISAGFPSPADDHIEKTLDLNEYLIKQPAATFFLTVEGDSMIEAGIFNNDTLVVDKSIQPVSGNIVIAVLNGELTVKRLKKLKEGLFLYPENKQYAPILITAESDFCVWGVVTAVIHRFQ